MVTVLLLLAMQEKKLLKYRWVYFGLSAPWDVNHDEYPDILICGKKIIYTDSVNYYFQPIIATYVNNGDSTFQPGVETLYGNSIDDRFFGFDIGNFNSDSEKDLLITDRSKQEEYFYQ